MKIEIDIRPRQSGKTKELIDQYLRYYLQFNPEGNIYTMIFVVLNQSMKRNIMDKVYERLVGINVNIKGIMESTILTPDQLYAATSLLAPFIGRKSFHGSVKTVLIDEYLLFDIHQQEKVFEYLHCHRKIENVYIKTTSNKLYNHLDLKLAKMLYYTDSNIYGYLKSDVLERLKTLKDNLLIHPSTKVIWSFDPIRAKYDPEQYSIQIEGRWLEYE